MTRLPLRAISVLLLSALMLPGCSSVKPMLSGSERKKRKVTKETPARIESHAPESCPDESQPIGDIDELGEKHADAAPVLLPVFPDKNRPEMTFGDLESANVRIPLKYNNPFPSSGELVLPLGEHENEFCYPYPGKLISPFGYRGSRMHTGIDIKAVPNDTVRAALPGVVRMSKYYSGYGNLVLIRHYNGIETVYAHNSKNLVRVNDAVEAGDPIALAGRTGRATTEHVHFEVRIASEPFNPTLFGSLPLGWIPTAANICAVAAWAFKIVLGLFAVSWYRNDAKRSIEKIYADYPEGDARTDALLQKGGTSFLSVILYYAVILLLASLVINLAGPDFVQYAMAMSGY